MTDAYFHSRHDNTITYPEYRVFVNGYIKDVSTGRYIADTNCATMTNRETVNIIKEYCELLHYKGVIWLPVTIAMNNVPLILYSKSSSLRYMNTIFPILCLFTNVNCVGLRKALFVQDDIEMCTLLQFSHVVQYEKYWKNTAHCWNQTTYHTVKTIMNQCSSSKTECKQCLWCNSTNVKYFIITFPLSIPGSGTLEHRIRFQGYHQYCLDCEKKSKIPMYENAYYLHQVSISATIQLMREYYSLLKNKKVIWPKR